MAVGETTLTMVGNVLSELSRRTVRNGHEVVSFWMRSNERKRDKDSGEWVDGRSFSVKVTCWRKLAESVDASLNKGDPVIVTGRVFTNEYEVDGQLRAIPELEAFAVGPNLNRCTATVTRHRRVNSPDVPDPVPWQQSSEPGVGSRDNVLAVGDETVPIG